MKKFILLTAAVCIVTMLQAQSNAIDEMFDRYAEKEGYTSVYISGRLFGLMTQKESGGGKESDIINRLKGIRILTVEDSLLNKTVNFYKELGKKLDFSGYEELMVVKEGTDMTKFLIKQKGDIISELLVITGGPGGNTLISIKGDLDLKTISELSKDSGMDELKDLEGIDKKE